MGIKGLDTLADVLDVVRSPEKFDAKVKELQALVAQYTEVAEAVVKLADVNDYTQNIKKREEETKVLLAKAKEEAKEIKDRANKYADDKFAEVRTAEAVLAKEASDLLSRSKVLDGEASEQAKEATALATFKQLLDKREADLVEAERVLAEKQAKLKAALA